MARHLGCRGAHQRPDGTWAPCESPTHLLTLIRRGVSGYRKLDEKALGAGIGRRLSGSVRRTLRSASFDPDARDADNDGLIQELTRFERPGVDVPEVPEKPAPKKPKLAQPRPKADPKPEKPRDLDPKIFERLGFDDGMSKIVDKILSDWNRQGDIEGDEPLFRLVDRTWDFDKREYVYRDHGDLVPGEEAAGISLSDLSELANNGGVPIIRLPHSQGDPDVERERIVQVSDLLIDWMKQYNLEEIVFDIDGHLVKFTKGENFYDEYGNPDLFLFDQLQTMFSDIEINWRAITDLQGANADVIKMTDGSSNGMRVINIDKEDVANVPAWMWGMTPVKNRILREDYDDVENLRAHADDIIVHAEEMATRIDSGEDPWDVLANEQDALLALRMADSIGFRAMGIGEGGITPAQWIIQNGETIGILKNPDPMGGDTGAEHIKEEMGAYFKDAVGLPAYKVISIGPVEDLPLGPSRHIMVEHLERAGYRVDTSEGMYFDEDAPNFDAEEIRDLIRAFVLDRVTGQGDRHQRNMMFAYQRDGGKNRIAMIDEGRAFTQQLGIPTWVTVDSFPTNLGWAIQQAMDAGIIDEEEVKDAYEEAISAMVKAFNTFDPSDFHIATRERASVKQFERIAETNFAGLDHVSPEDFFEMIQKDGNWNGEMSYDQLGGFVF